MTPTDILNKQGRQIAALSRMFEKSKDEHAKVLQALEASQNKQQMQEKTLQELKVGMNFRQMIERAAEMVIPFHNIVNIELKAQETTRVRETITLSSKGWFFADRVFASYRPTSGAYDGHWRPVSTGNPIVAAYDAAGTTIPDVPSFDWEYSENRTNMMRQNDSLTIPGDILFRSDSDGYLIGGDPWAPRSVITVGVIPRIAPVEPAVMTFVFLGSLCLNTNEEALNSWVARKQILGL